MREARGVAAGLSMAISGGAVLPVLLSVRGFPTMRGLVKKPPSDPTPINFVLNRPSLVIPLTDIEAGPAGELKGESGS